MADNSHSFLLEEPQVKRKGDALSRAIGLSILGSLALVLALIGIDVTVIQAAQNPPARPIVHRQVVRVSGTTPIVGSLYLSVTPGIKPGPDGKLHDAYSVTNFTVHAGQAVTLVINNTDDVPHSITSPSAGVNIVVKPGSHSYTLLVHKAGVFKWYCNYPCDPFSMMHDGYMRGTITAV